MGGCVCVCGGGGVAVAMLITSLSGIMFIDILQHSFLIHPS